MSQEFEKKVLEKLDNFEGRFDKIEKTLEEHTGILNDHTEQFKIVCKDIYKINNNLIKTAQKIEEIEDVVEYNIKL